MSSDPNRPDPDETIALRFRCVCGEEVAYRDSKTNCPKCGRLISSAATPQTQTVFLRKDMTTPAVVTSALPDDGPQPGDQIGHFEIIELLGAGGMGAVYLALDTSLQRYVALKVIRTGSQGSSASERVNRLKQEAIAQARLNDPNVVTIYFVGEHEGQPFFAMELVQGATLADRLAQGPIDFGQLIEIALQTCKALEHAQEFDIVHGDIKPSNLLLDAQGRVKLSDFGLARFLKRDTAPEDTISGTIDYLAPEILEGASPSFQSDMYALGVTLYEMTFGRHPLRSSGSSIGEKIAAAKKQDIEFPEKVVDVPLTWLELLKRLLAKSPGDRFSSFGELRKSLNTFRLTNQVAAGRFPRIAAYAIDATIVLILFGITNIPVLLTDLINTGPLHLLAVFVAYLIAPLGPLAFVAVETLWRKTPGRYLFQLQVVDRHQLPPPRAIILWRSLLRFTWLWVSILVSFTSLVSVWLEFPIMLSGFGFQIIDLGTVLVGPAGWSLHDFLCRTRVILDHHIVSES